ncbi:hypothetical protein [Acinetobacter sp. ANC 3813]|uniref:hypothetical protein n=1 Tax=Acinetobacter sp. ANC 3813 TaxID=1977873 RepID=UPI000A33ECDB|nr:hypothetical protein [Acinetobacter sp. ANC 3813]
MGKDQKLIEKCPACGHDEFYRKGTVSGCYVYRYRFDGEETYNGEMHDTITYKEGKTCYCAECHKPLGVFEIKVDRVNK